jgi:hypothetical protein
VYLSHLLKRFFQGNWGELAGKQAKEAGGGQAKNDGFGGKPVDASDYFPLEHFVSLGASHNHG